MESPRVFVSYSHDSDTHKKWVENLAFVLRKDFGIDVILDTWDLKLGAVLPKFMETLTEADRVLMICTDNYCEKCDQDDRSGVAYEKLLMSAELMRGVYDNTLIQILRDNESERLPRFVGHRLYADFNDDASFYDQVKKLAADIHGVEYSKPTLGKNPFVQGYDINFGQDGICDLPFRMFNAQRMFNRDDKIIVAGVINSAPKLCAVTVEGDVDTSFGTDGILSFETPGIPYGQSGEFFFVNDIIARPEDILIVPRFDLGENNRRAARFDYQGNFIDFEDFGCDQVSCVIYAGTAPIFHSPSETSVIVVLDETGHVQQRENGPYLVSLQGFQSLGASWIRCHAANDFLYVFDKRGPQRRQPFVSRFHLDGTLDTDFGNDGVVDLGRIGGADRHAFHNQVLSAASQPDGRILLGGAANEADIARLLPDGTPDETFGEEGIVDFRANFRGVCEEIIILDDGVLVVGCESSGRGIDDVFIGKLHPNGSLDTSFYGDGYFSVQLKGRIEYRDMFVSDDKITLLCNIDTESQRHRKAALARVHI